MEVLKCDICGGKLVMQAGKIAKCEYCGLEYSTESLREKVMEIKGTVNVQGIASAENILSRANEFYSNREFDKALEYYNKYLDLNPQEQDVKKKIAIVKNEMNSVKQKGTLCKGKVVEIREFGVFIELFSEYKVMIHISNLCQKRVDNIQDVVSIGDELWCVCLGTDRLGRAAYSAKEEPALGKNCQNIRTFRNYI